MSVCEFVGQDHPFAPQMNRIRGALERKASSLRPAPTAMRSVWQRELKGVPDGNGGWKIDRFYASLQQWDGAGDFPFRADTYHYSSKRADGEWFQFPSEPYLGALGELVRCGDTTDVLQYVVLRRLTFRARLDEHGLPRIGKFKRRSRARGAFDALAVVSDAAERQGLGFRVPKPLSFNHDRNLFYQEGLPGRPASTLLYEHNAPALLYEIGRVHAELHGLRADVGAAAEGAAIEALERECDWIRFFRPAEGARLSRVADVLRAEWPRLAPAPQALCHGDFVPSHVLHGPDGWCVVDFDLVHRGDPHADLALFIASLTLDVPMFQRAWRSGETAGCSLLASATEAYVAGYQSRSAAPVDRRRLLWHRIKAEIHLLALMFTKDRFHLAAFERSLDLVERMVADLCRRQGGLA